jgi:hypothetical protein
MAEFVPCASPDDAEGWEAGTGPTMIGRITDAGMGGIDDAEGASTCEEPLVAVKRVDVGRTAFAGS